MWALLRPDGVELHRTEVPGSVPADDRRPPCKQDEEWTDQQVIVSADKSMVVVVAPVGRISVRASNARIVRERLVRFLNTQHPSEAEKTDALKDLVRIALGQLEDITTDAGPVVVVDEPAPKPKPSKGDDGGDDHKGDDHKSGDDKPKDDRQND